jgi:F-type H+-transporting ATPase subunit b
MSCFLAGLPIASSAVGALSEAVQAAAGNEAVTVDLDKSVLLQVVLFSLLVIILKFLLFDPVLRVFALREQRTEGAKGDARHLQERAGELLRRYELEVERINRVAAAERERLRAETVKLEAEILHEAREAAARIIADGRHRIEMEVNQIRFDLGRESERAARQVAALALGREVN